MVFLYDFRLFTKEREILMLTHQNLPAVALKSRKGLVKLLEILHRLEAGVTTAAIVTFNAETRTGKNEEPTVAGYRRFVGRNKFYVSYFHKSH